MMKRICKVEGCDRQNRAKGYCLKHYKQYRKHGKTTIVSESTQNKIFFKANHCEMEIYNQYNFPKDKKVLFDRDDYERVKDIRWGQSGKKGYISNKQYGALHSFIIGKKEGLCIDHKFGNVLDNRKDKLRHCTESQNNQNSQNYITNKSGYKGVSWSKKDKVWIAQCSVNNKTHRIGSFKDKISAAKAYDKEILTLRGDFAVTNKSMELY